LLEAAERQAEIHAQPVLAKAAGADAAADAPGRLRIVVSTEPLRP
jgi:hypothetical protein